jgi:hypothetical protein
LTGDASKKMAALIFISCLIKIQGTRYVEF